MSASASGPLPVEGTGPRPPLFPPFEGLSEADLDRLVEMALAAGARFAEVFVERRFSRRVRMEEGRLRPVSGAVEAGLAVRAISGESIGFAHTSDPSWESVAAVAEAAGRFAATAGVSAPPRRPDQIPRLNAPPEARREPLGLEPGDLASRASYLEDLDRAARASNPAVSEVSAFVSEESRRLHVVNSAGRRARDFQVLTNVSATVYVRGGGTTHKGQHGGGGRIPFASLASGRLDARAVAAEAARKALVLLDSREAPAGEWPVIVGNGWGGVLLHEAIGHGFEADFIRRRTSAFTGRLGERIASDLCNVVDDGSIPGLRGSARVDDEGTPSSRTPLIERGVLAGFLHDLLSAGSLGARPTGNGRRHSFRAPPIPRQTNILLEAGRDTPAEIVRSVGRGLYAKSLGGGQVDIVNGNFVFEVTEGYLIEGGRVTAPVRGASLIGVGREVLRRISRVGCDFAFDPGLGTCGKEGQSVPVGVGQPTILIASMTVGGTGL